MNNLGSFQEFNNSSYHKVAHINRYNWKNYMTISDAEKTFDKNKQPI